MNRMDDALSLENRRRIFHYIRDNPGTHVREMERGLDMQPGLLSYHLDYLEKRQLIRSEDDGHRKMFFPIEGFIMQDRKMVGVLRQESPRRILIHLLIYGPTSFQDLQSSLGVAKSTLSYHLGRMVGRGIILSSKREREMIYHIEDPPHVADLLIAIRESLERDAVDQFADIWDALAQIRS
jgi:predicted transcriptional regulator